MALQPPSIGQNPLDFGDIPQGKSKTVQEVISNPTQQTLLWRADTSRTRWLKVNKSAGTLQPGQRETVNVTVDTSSLEVGDYAATLTFTSEGDSLSASTQVPIILTISPDPTLLLARQQSFAGSPLTVGLSFALNMNSSQTLPLAITNRDSQNTMKWRADTGETNWLTLDRSEGTLHPHEQQTIYVTANTTSSLAYGDYTNTMTFTTQVAGTGSVVQVQTDLHISPIPYGDSGPKAPIIARNYLDFSSQPTVGNNASLSFTNPVSNGVVDWIMSTGGVNWVILNNSAGPLQGTLQAEGQQTINVGINKTGLQAGNYITQLVLTFAFDPIANPTKAGLESTSVLIPVIMTVP